MEEADSVKKNLIRAVQRTAKRASANAAREVQLQVNRYVLMQFQISTLIFDMDGVITDTMPYHFRAWKSVFASEGITASHEDIYKREGQKGIDSVRELFTEKEKIYTDAIGKKLLAR